MTEILFALMQLRRVLTYERCSASDSGSPAIRVLRPNGQTPSHRTGLADTHPVRWRRIHRAGWGPAAAGVRDDPASPAVRICRVCRSAQDGRDELIATFDVTDLETVAAVLGAKRRRRLSDDQRARLKTAGANTRFSAPETTIVPEGDQCVA